MWEDDEDTRIALTTAVAIIEQYGKSNDMLINANLDAQIATNNLISTPIVADALRQLDNATQRDRSKKLIEIFYKYFIQAPETMRQIEADFNAEILKILKELPYSFINAQQELQQAAANALLEIPEYKWNDELSWASLLRADYQIVPFSGRTAELMDLEQWSTNGASLGIRLYIGSGGTGKSRLMIEACQRFSNRGWRAGLLSNRSSEIGTWMFWANILQQSSPVFIVIDYAETRRNELVALLQAVHGHLNDQPAGPPIRIVMVARSCGEWLDELRDQDKDVRSILNSKRFETVPLAEVLDSGKNSAGEQLDAYQNAHRRFAEVLDVAVDEQLLSAPDLAVIHPERVLLAHIAALLDVLRRKLGDPPAPAALGGASNQNADEILDELIFRERNFWSKQLTLSGMTATQPILLKGIQSAMSAITLGVSPTSEDACLTLFSKVKQMAGFTEPELRTVAGILHRTYPNLDSLNPSWVATLQPDLLGEGLVRLEMTTNTSAWTR